MTNEEKSAMAEGPPPADPTGKQRTTAQDPLLVDPKLERTAGLDLGGVSGTREAAAEHIGGLVIWVFAAALVLSIIFPAIVYWIVSRHTNPANPVTPEQSIAILEKVSSQGLEFVKVISSVFSSLLTLILSYYFFKEKGGK